MRETPLLLVSAACGFGVSSLHPIQLFLWDPAPAQRCLPFSRVLQTRRHTLPAPLCPPRQPQNTRPGSSPAAAGRERVLPPAGAQSNALPKTSSSTRAFHIFSGSLFPLAEQLVSGKIHRPAPGGARKGGLEGGEQKSQGKRGPPASSGAGQSAEQTLRLGTLGAEWAFIGAGRRERPVRWSPWGH